MNKALNILSILGSFMIVFGVLFLIQNETLGRIKLLNEIVIFKVIKFEYLLFTATSILFINYFIEFSVPKRGKK